MAGNVWLLTGLCSVGESSLSCTLMLCEMFVYKLYFNNTFQEAGKTRNSVSCFVRKNKDFGKCTCFAKC